VNRRNAWLIFGLIVIGVVLVGLLVWSFLPNFGWWGGMSRGGMMGRGCPWCGGSGFTTPVGFLASGLICLIPLGLLALIVVGIVWLVRSSGQQQGSAGRQEEQVYCPECGSAVEPSWKVCPYCGHNLEE